MSTPPQISMVMPCFEQVAFVGEAVRSVLDQDGVPVELLVMDPGSTDGSRDVLAALGREYGARLRLCFERDLGQSDAVNQGMAAARAPLLGWLNSDDRLLPGALRAVALSLPSGPQPRWLYGRAGMIDAGGARISSFIARYKSWRGRRFSFAKLLTENFIPQMAVFWTRALWDICGGLDTSHDLDMDYDLWLRFARCSQPIVLARELAEFRVHAAAKGSRRTKEQLAAALRTARVHARDRGVQGRVAIAVHRVLGARTRLLYRWLKP